MASRKSDTPLDADPALKRKMRNRSPIPDQGTAVIEAMSHPVSAFTSKSAFDEAVTTALSAAAAYYDSEAILMTDAEYDHLIEQIEVTVASQPNWDPEGLLRSVAAGTSVGGDIAHTAPMLSLGKVKALDDVRKFVVSVSTNLVVEPKLDGLAIRAEYKDGVLVLAATRGDGATGEDVTSRIDDVLGLPRKVPQKAAFEVRGEIFMTDADFEVANTNRVAAGKPAFVNSRNAVAGALRNTDPAYKTPMSFAAYDAIGPALEKANTYSERMDLLESWKVQTARSLVTQFFEAAPTSAPDAVVLRIETLGSRRAHLGYPIDGAVVKVDGLQERENLGAADRTPRWACAYKYAADTATTILRDIEVSVGRTGRVGVRAVLEPVFVGGTTVTFATLHHPKFIEDADFRIGDTVYVYRAGDVIPRVNAADVSKRPAKAKKWRAPEVCPNCSGSWDKSSLLWRCISPECSLVNWIVFALSRDVLNVDGASESFADSVVESGLVSDLADVFSLTIAQVAALPAGEGRQIGIKNATKIVEGIQAAKAQTLARHITSWNIRTVGRRIGRRLAAHFGDVETLLKATVEDLTEVEGIGAEKADAIHAGLRARAPMIRRLVTIGITIQEARAEAGTPASKSPLDGKKVVVTGRVPGLSRTEAQEAVERLGGITSSDVSPTTDLLVVGEGAGSKAAKAEKLGIKTMSADDFAKLAEM